MKISFTLTKPVEATTGLATVEASGTGKSLTSLSAEDINAVWKNAGYNDFIEEKAFIDSKFVRVVRSGKDFVYEYVCKPAHAPSTSTKVLITPSYFSGTSVRLNIDFR